MKAFSLLVALMALSSLGGNGNGSMNLREKAIDTDRPNGWYYVTSGKQDSLSAEPIVSTKEFAAVELDSFQNEQNKEMVYLIVGRVKDSSVKTCQITESAVQPRPGNQKDRTHGHPNRTTVQRIARVTRQQHGIHPEGGRRTKNGTKIGRAHV